jgi:hypothetical protein
MKNMIMAVMISLLLLGGVFLGCSGGGAKVQTETSTVTLGKQLIDLDNAYKNGALDEKQYKKAKSDLLKKYQ